MSADIKLTKNQRIVVEHVKLSVKIHMLTANISLEFWRVGLDNRDQTYSQKRILIWYKPKKGDYYIDPTHRALLDNYVISAFEASLTYSITEEEYKASGEDFSKCRVNNLAIVLPLNWDDLEADISNSKIYKKHINLLKASIVHLTKAKTSLDKAEEIDGIRSDLQSYKITHLFRNISHEISKSLAELKATAFKIRCYGVGIGLAKNDYYAKYADSLDKFINETKALLSI